MIDYRFYLPLLIWVLMFSGCGPRTLVVVAPDKEGKVGTVSVATPRGETILNSSYAAVRANKAGAMEPVALNEQQVATMFKDAIAVKPEPPLSFTLYFLEGKDELTPESRQRLTAILAEISRRGRNISEITVVGHTDRVGKLVYNDRLSLQRAKRVVDELVGIGVAPGAISAAGRGEREPLVPTEDETPEPKNRRVEVSVR